MAVVLRTGLVVVVAEEVGGCGRNSERQQDLEFDETRLYVQLVAENYAIYRYLYAGEDEPNLPD